MTDHDGRPAGRTNPVRPPVRVLIVEASPIRQDHLVRALEAEGDIAVVANAVGGTDAVKLTDQLQPDVVALDDHLREGDARLAIEQIMARTPTPILVLSDAAAEPRSGLAELLVAGAVDAMPRPQRWTPTSEADLRRRVRILRGVYVLRRPAEFRRAESRPAPPEPAPRSAVAPQAPSVAGIAASTGGPAALARVLPGLAGVRIPIVVVQHIHPDFVDGLVSWMARVTSLAVRVAVHGELLRPGVVYIGPAGIHLKLGPGLRVKLDPDPVTIHRPSADQLFFSMAEHAGAEGVGVLLTGIGDDGAKGLLALRQRGGVTIAQDQATSAVFGMPRAAQLAGAASMVLPLDEIAGALMAASGGMHR